MSQSPMSRTGMSQAQANTSARRRRRLWSAPAVALMMLAAACGGGSDEATPSSTTSADGRDACGFDAELLEAARDEGSVTIYTAGHTDEAITELTRVLDERYGIQANFVRQDSSSVIQQVEAERAAGNLNADAVALAESGMFNTWEADGVIVDAELPDTVEFIEGVDNPDVSSVPIAITPLGVMYNEARTDASEVPATYQELAEYDGRVAHASPASSGTALTYAHALTNGIADEDFYDDFGSNADVMTIESSLALAQLVAVGEADLAVPAIEPAVLAAAEGGEPLAISFPEGPVPVLVSQIAVMSDAQHPAAAKVAIGAHVCEDIQAEIISSVGARPVIAGVGTPDQVADISDREVVVVTQDELDADRETVIAAFDAGVR